MTDNLNGLAVALAEVQAELPPIAKGETATVTSERTGKSFKYSYADLADVSQVILPLLGKHGLSWITRPTMTEGRFVLAYELLHTSGESRTGEYPLPGSGTPQEIGSAITYARRYALCAVTGVAPAADDDDGAAATHRAQRDQFEDARPARPGPDPEQVRQNVLTNARAAITNASDADELLRINGRVAQAVAAGAITSEDYDDLARRMTERRDALAPEDRTAEQPDQPAQQPMDTEWPEPRKPGSGDPA